MNCDNSDYSLTILLEKNIQNYSEFLILNFQFLIISFFFFINNQIARFDVIRRY